MTVMRVAEGFCRSRRPADRAVPMEHIILHHPDAMSMHFPDAFQRLQRRSPFGEAWDESGVSARFGGRGGGWFGVHASIIQQGLDTGSPRESEKQERTRGVPSVTLLKLDI